MLRNTDPDTCRLFPHGTISIWEFTLYLLQLLLWIQMLFWLSGHLLTPPPRGLLTMCQLLLQTPEPWTTQHRACCCIPCLSSCHPTTTAARNLRWYLPHYTSSWIISPLIDGCQQTLNMAFLLPHVAGKTLNEAPVHFIHELSSVSQCKILSVT